MADRTRASDEAPEVEALAQGYLCDNWSALADTAALVLNPQASIGHKLVWCWAEVRSLQSAAQVLAVALSSDPTAVSGEDVNTVLVYRLAPLESMLALLVETLVNEGRQTGRSKP